VRNILTADHGFRIAVILNEFADDTSIERAIVSDDQVMVQVIGSSFGQMLCRHCRQACSMPALARIDQNLYQHRERSDPVSETCCGRGPWRALGLRI
jgi:hypothetical protein